MSLYSARSNLSARSRSLPKSSVFGAGGPHHTRFDNYLRLLEPNQFLISTVLFEQLRTMHGLGAVNHAFNLQQYG